ncbi:MAG: Gfo/Idh/MocA family oxidoreductase [Sedimentisphaerales bacterium]|nr:Gfo/Idh/MocA family oxidoreductase [Sedimentisphaerales bacterium]
MKHTTSQDSINRRSFLKSTAAVSAGLAFSPYILGQTESGESPDDLNVALLGAGAQGQALLNACKDIPGIRFKAVCDIWKTYNLRRTSRILQSQGHDVKDYVDYQEMLADQKDLDAVIIATPDFWHSPHACACLEAGLHVYCEKEMSNTIEGAKKMVETAKKTGKLLQIGHQRRSNPRYQHCYNKLIKEANLMSQITTINGQWNRGKNSCEDLGAIRDADIDTATLEKYGFKSMQQFRNWRWYKGLGGGPIVDLGSHQIDIYSWFLEANPKSVIASGGIDYWKAHDWYDHVMAIYEYETKLGTVRAFYQTITTNSAQGYFEQFMGVEGTLVISESSGRGTMYRESWVDIAKWEPWTKLGYITAIEEEEKAPSEDTGVILDVRESPTPPAYDIPVSMEGKLVHQPHLENFFDSIRGKAKLNCPAEIGFETAVTVLKVNEAIEAGRKLDFKPEEFKA